MENENKCKAVTKCTSEEVISTMVSENETYKGIQGKGYTHNRLYKKDISNLLTDSLAALSIVVLFVSVMFAGNLLNGYSAILESINSSDVRAITDNTVSPAIIETIHSDATESGSTISSVWHEATSLVTESSDMPEKPVSSIAIETVLYEATESGLTLPTVPNGPTNVVTCSSEITKSIEPVSSGLIIDNSSKKNSNASLFESFIFAIQKVCSRIVSFVRRSSKIIDNPVFSATNEPIPSAATESASVIASLCNGATIIRSTEAVSSAILVTIHPDATESCSTSSSVWHEATSLVTESSDIPEKPVSSMIIETVLYNATESGLTIPTVSNGATNLVTCSSEITKSIEPVSSIVIDNFSNVSIFESFIFAIRKVGSRIVSLVRGSSETTATTEPIPSAATESTSTIASVCNNVATILTGLSDIAESSTESVSSAILETIESEAEASEFGISANRNVTASYVPTSVTIGSAAPDLRLENNISRASPTVPSKRQDASSMLLFIIGLSLILFFEYHKKKYCQRQDATNLLTRT